MRRLFERHQTEYKTFTSLGLGGGTLTSSSSASSLSSSTSTVAQSLSSSSSSLPNPSSSSSSSSPAPLTSSNLSDLFTEFPSLDTALGFFSNFLKRDDTVLRQVFFLSFKMTFFSRTVPNFSFFYLREL